MERLHAPFAAAGEAADPRLVVIDATVDDRDADPGALLVGSRLHRAAAPYDVGVCSLTQGPSYCIINR